MNEQAMAYLELGVKLLFVFAAVFFLVGWIIIPNVRNYRRSKLPETRSRITVLSNETYTDIYGNQGLRGPHNHHLIQVAVQLEDGNTLTLTAPLSQQDALAVGSTGVLTHQGDRFLSFERDA